MDKPLMMLDSLYRQILEEVPAIHANAVVCSMTHDYEGYTKSASILVAVGQALSLDINADSILIFKEEIGCQ